jgi:hypothetical protein
LNRFESDQGNKGEQGIQNSRFTPKHQGGFYFFSSLKSSLSSFFSHNYSPIYRLERSAQ